MASKQPVGDVATFSDSVVLWHSFVMRHSLVMRFGDAVAHETTAANGDTAAISDAAAIGDVAPFDVMYEMHAFYPRQYICMLRMARQMRRGEVR